MENALGPLWPLILIMAGAAAVFIVWRSNNKILRVIAAAALLTAVVYVFTPLTAAGQEGSPTGFFTNTRYLIPGLILAMVMLPLARPLRAPERRAQITLGFLGVVYWVTVLTTPQWYTTYIFGTIFLTLALVWVPTALGLGRSRGVLSRRIVTIAGAVVLLAAVVLGRAQQVQYAEQHYTNTGLFLQEGGPQEAYEYAQKLQHQRIGIVGDSEIIFGQYGFFGNPPTNEVEYIGVPGPHGSYRLATSCSQFVERVNAGNYDYLIMSRSTEDSKESEYGAVLLPRLRVGERRSGAETGSRRAGYPAAARLRLQGQWRALTAVLPDAAAGKELPKRGRSRRSRTRSRRKEEHAEASEAEPAEAKKLKAKKPKAKKKAAAEVE